MRVVEGPDTGLVFTVAGDSVVGREGVADVVLADEEVSRRHLRLTVEDGHAILEDLGSRNGTFVNDERLQVRHRLRGGDRIKLGLTVLEFTAPVPADGPVTGGAGAPPIDATRARPVAGAGAALPPALEGAELRVMPGTGPAMVIPLRGNVAIGRDPSCDVVLRDEEVSRRHAQIIIENGAVFIADLGSTNGTFVNGERILTREQLEPGDEVQIGSALFGFVAPGLVATRFRKVAPQATTFREVLAQPSRILTADTGSRKWWTLLCVCLGVFMLLVDTTIVAVALPSISSALHATFSQLQWVIDAYSLSLAALLLVMGSLSDIVGRRRVFVIGLVVFMVTSAVCGVAGSPTVLDIARAVQGVGGAMMLATSGALIVQEFPAGERGVAFGVWGATAAAAVALGPLAGGALTQAFGWQAVFYVNLPIGLAVLALTLTRMVNLPGPPAAIDLPGLATFSIGLFMIVFAIIRGNDEGWTSTLILVLIAGGIALMCAFLAVESRVKHPLLELSLFRKPTFNGASITAFCLAGSVLSLILYLTLWLQSIRGYGPLQSGLRLLPITAMALLLAPPAGRLTRKVPPRVMLSVGMLLLGVGILLMHRVHASSGWTVLIPGFIVTGAGMGVANPALASTALEVVPPWRAGMASGINYTFRQLGLAVGIAALGAIFQSQVHTHVTTALAGTPVAGRSGPVSSAIVSGGARQLIAHSPAAARGALRHAALVSFSAGLNEILLVAGGVALVGALAALILVRSSPPAPERQQPAR